MTERVLNEEDEMTPSQPNSNGRAPSWLQLIVAVVTAAASAGIPALIWAGGTSERVTAIERQRDLDRREFREDLAEIKRKLDELMRRR